MPLSPTLVLVPYPLIQCHLQHGILAFLPLQREADALFLALKCFRTTWWGFECLGEGWRLW